MTRKEIIKKRNLLKKQYEENFDKLLKYAGTTKHDYYLKKEDALNREGIRLSFELGIMDIDPCGIATESHLCNTCQERNGCHLLKTKPGEVDFKYM